MTARILAGAAASCFVLAYCLAWLLDMETYLLLALGVLLTGVAFVFGVVRRPRDRVAFYLMGVGPLLLVVPRLFVWAVEAAGLVSEYELLDAPAPWEKIVRASAILWVPALSLFTVSFAMRTRAIVGPSTAWRAWCLFALGTPAWPVLPATLQLLRDGFGLPSPGLLVFLPVAWISIQAQRLARAACDREIATGELSRFGGRLAVVAAATLASSAVASFALKMHGTGNRDRLLAAYAPLEWRSFGGPFVALSVTWLVAAYFVRRWR
jgi:hypothetical protein